jgi:hypothetical protein
MKFRQSVLLIERNPELLNCDPFATRGSRAGCSKPLKTPYLYG